MPATEPEPALIFDFGNVIARFDYGRAARQLGGLVGLNGDDLLARVLSADPTALLRRYESGMLSTEAFSTAFLRLIDLDVAPDVFAAAWSDIFWLNEPVARLIPRIKALGHRLILGSNTNALHSRRFRRQFADVLSHFDRLILSHEIGCVKPSAAFYLACAAAAERPPQRCVFIDDLRENVEGARAAGLSAIHYQDDPGLAKDLKALGVHL